MIIKSLTRKTVNFSQPVRYILGKSQEDHLCWMVLHNIHSKEYKVDSIIKAFRINDNYRIKNKRSKNSMYHEIISFSDLDREEIIKKPFIMEDIARRYLQKRTDGLGMAYPHYDTDHPHVHLLLSANEVESTKSIRISKAEFACIKRDLEKYMIESYPELSNSIIKKHLKERGRQFDR